MKRSLCSVFGLFLLSPFWSPVWAQDGWNIDLLGAVHPFVEQAFDVAMSDSHAYLSSGTNSGLRVLDLSDPSGPVEIACVLNDDVCAGVQMWMTDRVKISGDRAYLLFFDGTWWLGHYRLYVYDITDPSAPQKLGFTCLPDECSDLFVSGDRVYVTVEGTGGFSGVKVIDVSDAMEPVEIGSFQTPGIAQSVFVEADHAYVADGMALLVYDVADPADPEFLGGYAPPGGVALIHRVTMHGGYVYVIDAALGLRVLDVSDPSQIEEVASLPHNQNDVLFSPVVISGDRAYYFQDGDISDKQLITLDVSDPADPQTIGCHDMPGFWWCYGFDCRDGIACVAGGGGGLRVVDVSHADSTAQIAHYDPYDLTSGLAVCGDHAFVGTYMNDLVIFDVSDPSAPVEMTAVEFPDSPIKQISVYDDHLYVPGVMVNHEGGVSVLDISDPTEPQQIAYWPAPEGYSGLPFNVERYGDYAFVACAIGGVELYDVSQIDQPLPLDNWTLWSPTNQDFAVTNTKVSWPYVFAPDRAYGLYVLDVSNPTDIVEVASCPTPGEAMWLDISADHGHVYIADADNGLRIIDVSHPLEPQEVGSYTATLEMATHVAASGDSVYVADGGQIGLHVIDVSDPTAPVEVAYHRTPGVYARDVVVVDGRVYMLDTTHLEIFEVAQEPSSADEAQPTGAVWQHGICSVCPNPFNSSTRINFQLAESGRITLRVYNIAGQKVQTLADGYYSAGRHACVFQAEELASGVYFLQLQANGGSQTAKVVLTR